MIQYIEQYLSRPEVFQKIAAMYPSAGQGLPTNIQRDTLEGAIEKIAAAAYLQRKQSALINSGLLSLQEIENG
jgi:hypothetical protein